MKTLLLIGLFAAFTQAATAQQKYPIKFYFKKDQDVRVQLVDINGQPLKWDIVGPITKDSLVALLPVGTHWLRFSIGTDSKTATIQRINKNPWTDVVNVNYSPKNGGRAFSNL